MAHSVATGAQAHVGKPSGVLAPGKMEMRKMIVKLLIVQVESKLAESELRKAAERASLWFTHHIGEDCSTESLASEQREVRSVRLREVVSREHHSRHRDLNLAPSCDGNLLSQGERVLHHLA